MSSEFSQGKQQIAIITIASMFTDQNFEDSPADFNTALGLLKDQHEKVQPPVIRTRLYRVIANNDPIIEFSEQMFANALHNQDFVTALTASNHLFAYAEMDYNDSLGGHSLDLALKSHRDFADIIQKQFSNRDPYLRMFGTLAADDAKKSGELGDIWREITILRGLIHTITLNGTLGIEAKQFFDPFALFQINK